MADQITGSVDSDVAELCRASSAGERRRSLEDVVRKVSRNAQRRGLTEEILQSLLAEE